MLEFHLEPWHALCEFLSLPCLFAALLRIGRLTNPNSTQDPGRRRITRRRSITSEKINPSKVWLLGMREVLAQPDILMWRKGRRELNRWVTSSVESTSANTERMCRYAYHLGLEISCPPRLSKRKYVWTASTRCSRNINKLESHTRYSNLFQRKMSLLLLYFLARPPPRLLHFLNRYLPWNQEVRSFTIRFFQWSIWQPFVSVVVSTTLR